MQVLRSDEFKDMNLIVTDLDCFEITRRYKVFRPPTEGKEKNSLVYVLNGEFLYTWGKERFTATEGSLYYLPKKTAYANRVMREPGRFILAEFNLFNPQGEEIVLSEEPLLLAESSDQYYGGTFKELADSVRMERCVSHLKRMSLFYEILYNIVLDSYQKALQDGETGRIMEGILYLEKHYLSDVSTEQLAELCSLSASQFRFYFKRRFGMSPVNYRNKLRMEKAYTLLKSQVYNVSEVADLVGFEDVYYFSSLFKKTLGVTPMSVLKGTRKLHKKNG